MVALFFKSYNRFIITVISISCRVPVSGGNYTGSGGQKNGVSIEIMNKSSADRNSENSCVKKQNKTTFAEEKCCLIGRPSFPGER